MSNCYDTCVLWISSGTVLINPQERVYIGCGSEFPVEPESILDNLEANAVVVWSEDKASKVAIISLDSLFLGVDVVEQICAGISGVFKQEEIFLAASHTHTAPMIDETKPRLGMRNDSYAAMIVERIVQMVLRVESEKPKAVNLRKYNSTLGGIVERRNRRLFQLSRNGLDWRPLVQRPNLRKGGIGAGATIAEFLDVHGGVVAVLAVVPCHPVALMGKEMISADYVGGLRAGFRERICATQETPFVFLQGASGDLNPWWKPKWFDEGLIKIIDQIVNGVRFSTPKFTIDELVTWCELRVQELVSARDKYLKSSNSAVNDQAVKSSLHRFPLAGFLAEAKDIENRQVYVHKLQVGDLKLVGVSAEVTSELKQDLKGQLGGSELVGCIRDSFGYATSSRQYLEGGYEVKGHQWSFSISHLREKHPGHALQEVLEKLSQDV